MASPYIFPNGFGGLTGGSFATSYPLWCSGTSYYVNSGTGSDAYAGTDRAKPFATLAAALAAASAGDTLVVMENHAESVTVAVAMNKANLWVVGEGSGSSRPKFTCAGTIAMFDITAAGVAIDNIYFPSSTAVPTARVRTASTETIIRSCYFECGASDTASALRTVTGAGQLLVKDTTFISTATAIASLPSVAFEVVNAINDIDIDNVTFQGGTYGWSDYAFKGGAAVTRLDAINLDLLSGSDFSLATGSSYRIHVRSQSGASKVVIAA